MVFKYSLLCFVVTIGCVAAKSSDGEGCIFKTTGEYGVCTKYDDCATARTDSCRGTRLQVCASYEEDGSVCCKSVDCPPLPPGLVNIPVTGYKAWDYCVRIAELAFPCESLGDTTSRTDACPQLPDRNGTGGGTLVLPGEYPHLVLLNLVDVDVSEIVWNDAYIGTLISDKWVLTSAFAATDSRTYAKVGGLAEGGTVYKIVNRIRHPSYSALYNDIGLIELEKSVTFSKLVLPACLHTGSVLPEEKLKDIVRSTTYWSRDVDYISYEECANLYDGNDIILPNGVNEFTQFCVRRTSGDDLASLYGAPIQVYNGASVACTQTVLGVFTSSVKEEHLITRVAPFISWIESIVWP